MGWFNSDHPAHEGYLVALLPDKGGTDGFRELGDVDIWVEYLRLQDRRRGSST